MQYPIYSDESTRTRIGSITLNDSKEVVDISFVAPVPVRMLNKTYLATYTNKLFIEYFYFKEFKEEQDDLWLAHGI
jgi:hypothetical protein